MTSPHPKFFRNQKRQRRLIRKMKPQGFTHKEFMEWLNRQGNSGVDQKAAENIWRKRF